VRLFFCQCRLKFLKLNSATWSLWWVKPAVWKSLSQSPPASYLSNRPSRVDVMLMQLRSYYRYRTTDSKDRVFIRKTLRELLTVSSICKYKPLSNFNHYRCKHTSHLAVCNISFTRVEIFLSYLFTEENYEFPVSSLILISRT
jgi:hypothetical protein